MQSIESERKEQEESHNWDDSEEPGSATGDDLGHGVTVGKRDEGQDPYHDEVVELALHFLSEIFCSLHVLDLWAAWVSETTYIQATKWSINILRDIFNINLLFFTI